LKMTYQTKSDLIQVSRDLHMTYQTKSDLFQVLRDLKMTYQTKSSLFQVLRDLTMTYQTKSDLVQVFRDLKMTYQTKSDLIQVLRATYGMVPVHEWGASTREVRGKFSNFMHLKQFDSIAPTRISSGAPLYVADECGRVCCTDAADVALTMREWDTSSRKVSSKLSKFTDPTKFARIAAARLNWGAPLAGADNIKRMGCITATDATIALCEWEASLREMSSNLSKLAELRKFVRIDGAHINSGAPLAGAGDSEQMRCTAAANATLAMRNARKMYKIVSRWENMHYAKAFGRWHNVYATNRQNARKLQKILTRRQKMKYAKAFGTGQEQTKAQRKLRVAATKVVKRWANKTVALAWGKWWREVRHSRVAKRVVLKWMQNTICTAWRT
jgi:cation transport regulator ChaB